VYIGKKGAKTLPETQRQPTEISRRNLLRSATAIAGGAIVLAGAITATRAEADATKTSQKAADYQAGPKNGLRCADCSLFQEPSSCQLVEGTVSRVGWCKFFVAKS
jgi:hypothetical protein